MSSDQALTFGDFDLLASSGGGWTCEALGSSSGSSWGDTTPLTEAVASFLADGAAVATTGHENRTLTLVVRLVADTVAILADAEAALVAECVKTWNGSRNTLVWTPPGGAPPCVFDVVAAELTHTFDDYAETQPSTMGRAYTLSLTALPWCRSSSAQVVAVANAGREAVSSVRGLGSVAAPLSVQVSHPSAALGRVLVHTVPTRLGVQSPPLRALLSAGPAATATSGTASGYISPLLNQHTFTVPASKVPPAAYQAVARVRSASTSLTLTWTTRALMGGAWSTAASGSTTITLTANTWTVVPLALLNLPPRALGAAGSVQVLLSSSVACDLDEAWLFNVTDGALTWVDAGSGNPTAGGPSKVAANLAPSADYPGLRIMLGNAADGSDWVAGVSEVTAFGVHEMDPGGVDVTTVATDTAGTTTTLTWFACWHTHAAA